MAAFKKTKGADLVFSRDEGELVSLLAEDMGSKMNI
jgi:hypothetical protein